MNSSLLRLFATVLVGVPVGMVGCSSSGDEEQVRELIDAVEQAAEERSTSSVLEYLADDYRDGRGADKEQIRDFLRAYFITHPKIELLVNIKSIEFETVNRARVQVEIALIGTQLGVEGQSLAGEAESWRVEVMRRNGAGTEWRVTRVDRTGEAR